MPDALDGLKVVELRQGIGAAYCGMLLGDLGAQVVIVHDQRTAADPDPPPAAQLYLDRNKQSVVLDLDGDDGRQILDGLFAWADVAVEELLPATRARWRLNPDDVRSAYPYLVYAAITPFGRTGPEADRPGTDLIVQARAAYMTITGFPDDPYTRSGTSLSEYYTGIAAGVGILAALRHRDHTGEGQLVDMALHDTLLTAMEAVPDDYLRTGDVRARTGNMNPSIPGYGFTQAADGFVATATPGFNIWPRFCAAIGRPDLAERPQFKSQEEQDAWGAVALQAIQSYCGQRTRAEIVEHLVAEGVPAAPVNPIADAVHDPSLRVRDMLVEVDHPTRGRITITGSPLHMSETPGQVRRPAPIAGQDTDSIVAEIRATQSSRHATPAVSRSRGDGTRGALEGIRVIDLGTVIAGPYNTSHLADLGAEIIKVEEPLAAERRNMPGGGIRFVAADMPAVSSYRDRNKEAISLDLRRPEALAVLRELVRDADVVTENFSPGTMERIGIGYEDLKAINPRLVYLSVSSFGQTGPFRHQRGYDILAQARTGYASVTGFPTNPPTRSGNSITDYYAGLLSSFSILSALRYRDRTGKGQAIDIALFEALFMNLEGYVERALNDGDAPTRHGNESLTHGPSCAAFEARDGALVAVDAHRDEWWAALCPAIGRPELATDARTATYAARANSPDLVRATLADWIAGRTATEAEEVLVAASVPASRVLTVPEMVELPQVQERGVYATVDHPIAGPVLITGTAFGGLSATPGRVFSHPPLANEHARVILKRVLGYDDQRIDHLEAAGVFSTG